MKIDPELVAHRRRHARNEWALRDIWPADDEPTLMERAVYQWGPPVGVLVMSVVCLFVWS